jgi:hypothetical protein
MSMAEDTPPCDLGIAWPHQPAAKAGVTALLLTASLYWNSRRAAMAMWRAATRQERAGEGREGVA